MTVNRTISTNNATLINLPIFILKGTLTFTLGESVTVQKTYPLVT